MYGCGVKDIQISYRAGRENQNADALSRSPYSSSPAVGIAEGEVQVASVTSQDLAHEDAEITPRHDLTNSRITAVTFGQDETAYERNGESATSRQKSTASKAGPSNSTATKELPKSGVGNEQTTSLPDSDAERSTSDEATVVQELAAGNVTPGQYDVADKTPGTLQTADMPAPSDDFRRRSTTPVTTSVPEPDVRTTPETEPAAADVTALVPEPHVDMAAGEDFPMSATVVILTDESVEITCEVVGQPTSVYAITSQSNSPPAATPDSYDLGEEQQKDPEVKEWIDYLSNGSLPEDENQARRIVLQSAQLFLLDGTIYHVNSKTRHRRAVVPVHLRPKILQETHSGRYSGHFSGRRLYDTLMSAWWWPGMYTDAEKFARSCPECVIATGTGRRNNPPLHPIPVQRPFQVLGIDVMDLPTTERGNKHVVVIQDLFTKWPMVFPVPDLKALRIARIIAEEVVPLFGVPECLLSDRGTNLLSHLVLDLCSMLGITKLNTTAHHPQCDGAVERFNRTLKTMPRKHAARYGSQWDSYLSGVLWAYRNTPHTSTEEKPSFLLFGMDCRSPTEAAYMPVSDIHPCTWMTTENSSWQHCPLRDNSQPATFRGHRKGTNISTTAIPDLLISESENGCL